MTEYSNICSKFQCYCCADEREGLAIEPEAFIGMYLPQVESRRIGAEAAVLRLCIEDAAKMREILPYLATSDQREVRQFAVELGELCLTHDPTFVSDILGDLFESGEDDPYRVRDLLW